MAQFQHGIDWHRRSFSSDSPSANRNHVSSPFLGLPYILQDDRTAPFKAPESDTVSLSMKKRHHPRHSLSEFERGWISSRAISIDENDSAHAAVTKLARSKSLPDLLDRDEPPFQDLLSSWSMVPSNRVAQHPNHQRRWTLPCKAVSTQGLSMQQSVFRQRRHHRHSMRKQSPAMITLRRATNGLDRGTNITFFPPPKFSGSKSSLMSFFLGAVVGDDSAPGDIDKSGVTRSTQEHCVTPTHSVSNSSHCVVEADTVNPTVTEIIAEPLSLPLVGSQNATRLRRCSTRYITGNSTYEVIWDESDTPSVTSSSTPQQRQPSDTPNRRQSVAVTQLEAQLGKAIARSDRLSSVVEFENTRSDWDSWRRRSFQSMLDSSFSRLINESALRNLPRSKAAKGALRSKSSVSAELPTHEAIDDTDSSLSRGKVDFFPPLTDTALNFDPDRLLLSGLDTEKTSKQQRNFRTLPYAGGIPTEGSESAEGSPGTNTSAQTSPREDIPISAGRTAYQRTSDDLVPLLDTFRWSNDNDL